MQTRAMCNQQSQINNLQSAISLSSPPGRGWGVGSWSQCTASKPRALSMNRTRNSLEMNGAIEDGSWSRCMRKKRKGALHEPWKHYRRDVGSTLLAAPSGSFDVPGPNGWKAISFMLHRDKRTAPCRSQPQRPHSASAGPASSGPRSIRR